MKRLHRRRLGLAAIDVEAGDSTITGCDITSDAGCCICIRSGATPTIRDCKLSYAQSDGIYAYDCGKGVVENCDIFGCLTSGVTVESAANPLFKRCRIVSGKYLGVKVSLFGRGVFQDCTISGHLSSCVVVDAESPCLPAVGLRCFLFIF